MMTMYEDKKNPIINNNSLELLYFYIPEYLIFKETGFCLYPKYNIDVINNRLDNFILQIEEKKSFVDLFENYNINLKIICGENGAGKTSLLKLLSYGNISKNNCIYVFKDKNNNFLSSKPITIKFNGTNFILKSKNYSFDSSPANTCVNTEKINMDEDFTFERNITKHFYQNKDLYKNILSDNIITNFNISFWNIEQRIYEILNGVRKNLFVNYSGFLELKPLFKENFFLFYFCNIIQYIDFDQEIEHINKEIINNNNMDFIDFIDKLFFTMNENLYNKIISQQNLFFNTTYKLEDIELVNDAIQELNFKIHTFLKNHFKDFNYPNITNYLYYEGFSIINGKRRYINNQCLSSGEYQQMKYTYEIFNSITQSDGTFWYIDEPEKSLHPEWCRNFIQNYMIAIEKNRNYAGKIISTKNGTNCSTYKNKRFTILFATHSPFLLSDVTSDYIIYLKKDLETGLSHEVKIDKNTFAGNIGEMFSTNFFMKNTIGEFARNYLKEIISNINSIKQISVKQISIYSSIINSIGDDLLKSLLKEKLENKIATNKIDTNSNE